MKCKETLMSNNNKQQNIDLKEANIFIEKIYTLMTRL